MRKFSRKTTTTILSCAMIAALAIGGTMAYLTDSETSSNVFTMGSVKVDLEEPNYPGNNSAEVTDVVPNEEINKDPLGKNTGDNDAIFFIKMTVPVETVQAVDDDGTKHESAPSELFFFKDAQDDIMTHANNFEPLWIELKNEEEGTDLTGTERTYVFGYKTKVAPKSQTEPLFDKVQIKNYAEGYIDGSVEAIDIDLYAIQSDNIMIADIDTSGDLDAATLDKIYKVFMTQNPEIATNGSSKDADNNNAYDLHNNERTTQDNVTLSIDLAVDNTKLTTGNTAHASAAVNTSMEEQGYTFSSEHPEVATVDAETGLITAVAPGKTKIKATSKAKKNNVAAETEVEITVQDAVSVDMGVQTKKLQVGDKTPIKIQVNSTDSNYTVAYESSDTSVAKIVNASEGEGKEVEAVGPGSAVIKVTVTYRDQNGVVTTTTATDAITVDVQAEPVG